MKVVVIGNGIAGFSAASTIRSLDERCEITMISKEATPLYSPCVLFDYMSNRISREQTFIKAYGDYQSLSIRTLFGQEVKEINPKAKKVIIDGENAHSFDKLILSMGGDAIVLGPPKKGAFKIKTLIDADELLRHKGEKAVVVGSGAIGIGIAIALHFKGYDVTIIEILDRVLSLGLDRKGAIKVTEILEGKGIRVLAGERADRVLGRDHVEGLATNKRELECDTLIWAIGTRPNVELARSSGIKIGDKGGIAVDDHMETNVSGIYACGDCVETNDLLTEEQSLNLFWHNASRQGRVAAQNCMGMARAYPGSQKILNLDVFGNHVVGFGYTEEAFYKLRNMRAVDDKHTDPLIIEREGDGVYQRLVVFEDQCIGGQFINVTKDLGLIWSIMSRKRSIEELAKFFDSKERMYRRPWLDRVRPFFKE